MRNCIILYFIGFIQYTLAADVHSFQELKSAVSNNDTEIRVVRSFIISEPIIISEASKLKFQSGKKLIIEATLTVNGSIEADRTQIFEIGSGKIIGSPKINVSLPEWFGGGANKDKKSNVQLALDLFPIIGLGINSEYHIYHDITIRKGATIFGSNASLIFYGSSLKIVGATNILLENINLDFQNENGFLLINRCSKIAFNHLNLGHSTSSGLLIKDSEDIVIRNSTFHNNYKNGLYLFRVNDFTLDNVQASKNNQFGIYISGAQENDSTTIYTTNGTVYNCSSTDNGHLMKNGVHMFSGTTLLLCKNVNVLKSRSQGNQEHGFVVQACEYIELVDCISHNNVIGGLMIQDFLDKKKILTTGIAKEVVVFGGDYSNNGKDSLQNHHQHVAQNGISIHGENNGIVISDLSLKNNKFGSVRTNSARKPTQNVILYNLSIQRKFQKNERTFKFSGATEGIINKH